MGALDGEEGADRSTVLWRRHERVSDRIFLPQVSISFRSGLDRFREEDEFPVIPDPDTSRDQPGDINFSGDEASQAEVEDVLASCQDRWVSLLRDHGAGEFTPGGLPGIPVVNARQLPGLGGSAFGTPQGVPGRAFDSHDAWSPLGGHVFLEDRSFSPSGDADARIFAHELGHVFGLWHTEEDDNLMKGVGDGTRLVRRIEDAVDWPSPPEPFTGVAPRTIDQIAWLQGEVVEIPDVAYDPPPAVELGQVAAFVRVDRHREIPAEARFVDLSAVTVSADRRTEVTRVTHRLLTPEPTAPAGEVGYWAYFDLDDDRATGGRSGEFPEGAPRPALEGIDLITQARWAPEEGGPPALTGIVWKYHEGRFVPITQGVTATFGRQFQGEPGPPSPSALFGLVTVELRSTTRGPVADVFRIQACARDAVSGAEDCLDTGGGGPPPASLVPTVYPVCQVVPGRVRPGSWVEARVWDLDPDSPLHLVLGDRLAALGNTDVRGEATVPFTIPADSRKGPRLVTVGVDHTAFTADCIVEVSSQAAARPSRIGWVVAVIILLVLAPWIIVRLIFRPPRH
ncbi:MAG TPA: hypothetical protein VF789_16480 [Thermoanaerobaculia bacterium]